MGIMEQFTTKDGKIIQYNSGAAIVIDPVELAKQKELIESQIAVVKVPSDKELLVWAKTNYLVTDTSGAIEELQRIDSILESIK